jgi:predicted amidohydrolase YtcJ
MGGDWAVRYSALGCRGAGVVKVETQDAPGRIAAIRAGGGEHATGRVVPGRVASVIRPWALVGPRVWAGPEDGIVGDAVGFGADGRVAAAGPQRDVLSALPAGAAVRRTKGDLVIPGFVDAHLHVRAAVAAQLSVDARRARSARWLLGLIAERISHSQPRALIPVWGVEPALFDPPELPDRRALDGVAGDHPVVIRLRSCHGWMLSSSALARAGLPSSSPDLIIDYDGALRGRFGPVAEPAQFQDALTAWSKRRLADGVVAAMDATVTNRRAEIEQLEAWQRAGVVRQRVAALAGDAVEGAAGLKVVPDPRSDVRGQLRTQLRLGWRNSMMVAVHCADIETLGAIVDVVEQIPEPACGRLRIEHGSICPPEWIERVAAFGAGVVTHPGFVFAHGDRYLADASLAPHEWLYRLRSWLDGNVKLAVGSDEPAGPAAPLTALRTAMTRRTSGGRTLGGDEGLTASDALATVTAWSADLSGLAGYGRIRAGAAGAVVVLEGDPFVGARAEQLELSMVVTDGRTVE